MCHRLGASIRQETQCVTFLRRIKKYRYCCHQYVEAWIMTHLEEQTFTSPHLNGIRVPLLCPSLFDICQSPIHRQAAETDVSESFAGLENTQRLVSGGACDQLVGYIFNARLVTSTPSTIVARQVIIVGSVNLAPSLPGQGGDDSPCLSSRYRGSIVIATSAFVACVALNTDTEVLGS